MSDFHTLKISEVKRETPSAVSISFDVPEALKPTFAFKAGQYITLRATIDNKEVRRAYSICETPNDDILKVAVKAVADGSFSKYANEKLEAGQNIEVMPPDGRFTYIPTGTNKNVAAFAAGSGITPIMAIAKTVLRDPNRTFTLVYGNKTPQETIFRQEILELQQKYTNRFNVHFVYSQAREDGAQFGRIDKSIVNLVVKNKHKDIDFDAFYLCGPEAMINLVSDTLKENGTDSSNIHFELFTASEENTEIEASLDGRTQLTVHVDDEEFKLDMDQKSTVLEAVLKEDIDAPYSCQGGVCSSCIARVKEGTAAMVQNQILTDSELAEGFILTCQAHPTSAKLVIDYDDV